MADADTGLLVDVEIRHVVGLARRLAGDVVELDRLLIAHRRELTPEQYQRVADELAAVGVAGGELLQRDVRMTDRRESREAGVPPLLDDPDG